MVIPFLRLEAVERVIDVVADLFHATRPFPAPCYSHAQQGPAKAKTHEGLCHLTNGQYGYVIQYVLACSVFIFFYTKLAHCAT